MPNKVHFKLEAGKTVSINDGVIEISYKGNDKQGRPQYEIVTDTETATKSNSAEQGNKNYPPRRPNSRQKHPNQRHHNKQQQRPFQHNNHRHHAAGNVNGNQRSNSRNSYYEELPDNFGNQKSSYNHEQGQKRPYNSPQRRHRNNSHQRHENMTTQVGQYRGIPLFKGDE